MAARYDLMPHQERGADFLAERHTALLLDEPGAGKTGQAVAAADRIKARRVLVIAPALVRPHWGNSFQFQQDIDRPIHVIADTDADIPLKGDTVTIISHAALVSKKRLYALEHAQPYDAMIVDESAEFRRFEAIRTRNLMGEQGLWRKAKHRWFLTGTPIVGSAVDLYPLALGPLSSVYGPAPSWWDFASRFAELKPDGFDGWKAIGIKEPELLADMLRPIAIRRTLESAGFALPPLTIETGKIELPSAALAEAMAGLEDWTPQRMAQVLEDTDEIRDAAISRVRHALGIAKALFVADAVYNGGEQVVVFFQHQKVKDLIGQELTNRGLRVSYIDGTITRSNLAAAESWFQRGLLDVLLVQTQAGGLGLTLTHSHRVVVAELPWTATALYQAIARVHRYTQKEPVFAEIMQANGCWLDDVLAAVVQRKHAAAQKFLELLTTG